MAAENTYLWDWEKVAQGGGEMPAGLPLVDQMAFTTMRNIYTAYHQKRITREIAAAEKKKVWRSYEQMRDKERFDNQLAKCSARMFAGVELAVTQCKKDPTPENVRYLCRVMDGMERPGASELIERLKLDKEIT